MRQAAKNILYTVVNSRAYNEENLNPGTPIWQTILMIVNVIVVALVVLWEVKLVKNFKKRQKETV